MERDFLSTSTAHMGKSKVTEASGALITAFSTAMLVFLPGAPKPLSRVCGRRLRFPLPGLCQKRHSEQRNLAGCHPLVYQVTTKPRKTFPVTHHTVAGEACVDQLQIWAFRFLSDPSCSPPWSPWRGILCDSMQPAIAMSVQRGDSLWD